MKGRVAIEWAAGGAWAAGLALAAAGLVGAPRAARAQESARSGIVREVERALADFERAAEAWLGELGASAPGVTPGVYQFRSGEAGAPGMLAGWPALGDGELPARVVVLVHGLDDPGDVWEDLAPELARAGHGVVRLEYPNDQAIAASGALVREQIAGLRARGVERMDLVCHSMGGLVAWDALTRAGEDGLPTTGRIVTIGTPWEGSPWAGVRALSEVREVVQRWVQSESRDPAAAWAFLGDGSGEAGADLVPGSEYLTELLARPAPACEGLTVIVGRLAQGAGLDPEWIGTSELLGRVLGAEERENLLGAARRAAGVLGDGVVPMDSAFALDAPDTVVLEANHRGLVRRTPVDFLTGGGGEMPPPAVAVVLERLGKAGER